MKILAVCPKVPSKNKSGDQVLSFNRLTFLAKKNSVEVICFGSPKDHQDILHLESFGIKVSTIKWQLRDFLWFSLKAIFDTSVPFQCAFYTSSKFRNEFNKNRAEFNPDVIYSVTVRPLLNIGESINKLYVDMVDSLGLNFSRRVAASRGLKRLLYKIEAKRISTYERQITKRSTISFVVSDLDREYIGERNIEVLPLGVDLDEFSISNKATKKQSIIFSGNMFYGPNIEAVLWFVKYCWPTIKKVNRHVSFWIVGSNPSSSITSLASDLRITVTGRVHSMPEMLNQGQISIAPMKSGSGMQFKILEAMACGLPVVASSIGLGDIKALDNNQILVRDNPKDFIASIIKLLQDEKYRISIAHAGNEYVLERHNWNTINAIFSERCKLD